MSKQTFNKGLFKLYWHLRINIYDWTDVTWNSLSDFCWSNIENLQKSKKSPEIQID